MGMHSIRVDDDLWRCALARARTEDRTITEVIATGLRGYIGIAPPVRVARTHNIMVPERARPVVTVSEDPCPHPKARVIKGFCGACGTGGLA